MVQNQISSIIKDIRDIVRKYRAEAAIKLNETIIHERWEIGRRIVEEDQKGQERAEYGTQLIPGLSKQLTLELGRGFSERSLAYYRKLYSYYPNWQILQTRLQNLSWSHIQTIIGEEDEKARDWYLAECSDQMWSVKTLERNIGSKYYHRLLASSNQTAVENEMKQLTSSEEYKSISPENYIKSPYITEFLGLPKDPTYTESELESALITHLQEFIMELGKGFAFVERQQHIVTDAGDYFIDLVFYNYLTKSFFLIDLKTKKITHQDIGQMDMYVRMYDDLKRTEGDNPTFGIVLCAETSEDIAKYSILNGNQQLFASKYIPFLPTEEELQKEIETQKRLFLLQKGDKL